MKDHPLDTFGNVIVLESQGWNSTDAKEDKEDYTAPNATGFITDTTDYLTEYIYQRFWPSFAPIISYPQEGQPFTNGAGNPMAPIYTHPDQDANAPPPMSR